MSVIIGIILVLVAIVLAFYVGFYLFLIKGAVKIIELIKSDTAVPGNYVVPVIKVMASAMAGVLVLMFIGLPGLYMILR